MPVLLLAVFSPLALIARPPAYQVPASEQPHTFLFFASAAPSPLTVILVGGLLSPKTP